jgi:hypothetical protein
MLTFWEPRREVDELPGKHPTSHPDRAEDRRDHQQDCAYATHPTFKSPNQGR